MFGSLFENEEDESEQKKSDSTGVSKQSKLDSPPEPRGQTGICGLRNQGATCYLNSLLQTLFFTPEFRDGLFQLRPDDLGYESNSTTNSKFRVIPVQLQKLFAKLLLLDQDSVGTSELTDSFGWTGNEGFQQHDVQELNRILFSALDSSLVGTAGEALIKNLYHGTSVTKVICQECSQVSEREEDYLDLPLILSGCSGLEQSMSMSYVAMEILEGANQYKCESCNKHVNATKGSKIRTLPPILTFSLLRFDYDFQRGERFKDNKRYSFPVALNMKDYCESSCLNEDDHDYELFSVVIHGGSCYGGHYHAYIRDVEGLGTWREPEKEQVRVIREDDTGQQDVIQCGNPVELISTLLKKLGGAATVNQLCQFMSKETGISWNKRFKSQYGPLTKFFKKHSDVFKFSDFSGWVSVLSSDETSHDTRTTAEQKQEQDEKSSSLGNDLYERRTQSLLEGESLAESGHHWFDVNDSRISCIHEKDLQHQFAGKESAYMLFYRRKNLVTSTNDSILSVPAVLRNEVGEMNINLTKQRENYDVRLNQISVQVLFGTHYTVTGGILTLKQGVSTEPLVISMDRRKSVSDLLQTVIKLESFRDSEECKTLHITRRLPSGLHLFEELTQHPDKSLLQSGVHGGTEVFLWNGTEVDGHKLFPGEDTAPVLINITYSLSQDQEAIEIQKHFRKDTTVGEMKVMLSNSVGISDADLLLSWVKSKGKTSEIVPLNSCQDGHTISEICLQDGDHLVAETKVEMESRHQDVPSLASQENEKHSNMMSFVVENRCLTTESDDQADFGKDACWPSFLVKVHKEQTIGDLKAKVLTLASNITDTVCRLRADDDYQGLSPPLYEQQTVDESWLKEGQKLVLEAGAPLLEGQIMIRYYINTTTIIRKEMEQVINKTCTVRQCLQLLMENSNLQGMTWHLRKTDWTGEPSDALDNEDATLESENVKNGDTLIVEEGRIPPKGFVRIALWQVRAKQQSYEGALTWITSGIQSLLGTSSGQTTEKMENSQECDSLEPIGDVEISQDASLYDLKLQISLLPQLTDHVIPTPGFIRLQEIVNNQLTRVLRGVNRPLRQLKLTSSTRLSVCILQHEEDLSPSSILLKLKRRIPEQRSYYAEQEVIFEPTEGASPAALRHFVAKVCDIPVNQLHMAKHFRDKYEWMIIEDKPKQQGKHKGRKKKINLRQSPFHLQDGDIIGVKDCHFDAENRDDFSTPADDEGKQKLLREEEEKKQRRKEKRARRPEVSLTIHVDDFR